MFADLVLEGGGAKGLGLVGAAAALEDAGYEFSRLAGTSAGAITAALLAAGYTADELETILMELELTGFLDETLLHRVPLVGKPLSLAFQNGIYEGDAFRAWIAEMLAVKGVATFGDLKITDDPETGLTRGTRYRLVVMATDVTQGRLVRLPWDYRRRYGLAADEQHVADAVRASMSIPFFYEPVRLTGPKGTSLLVDGGVVSNFPIDVFDRTDGEAPRWPTFGVRLFDRADANLDVIHRFGPAGFTMALLATMVNAHDQLSIDDPCVEQRTMLVETSGVSPIDFDLAAKDKRRLLLEGRDAARRFLKNWDWEAYLATCR